jgi:hypothetical protein
MMNSAAMSSSAAVSAMTIASASTAVGGYFVDQKKGEVNELKQVKDICGRLKFAVALVIIVVNTCLYCYFLTYSYSKMSAMNVI